MSDLNEKELFFLHYYLMDQYYAQYFSKLNYDDYSEIAFNLLLNSVQTYNKESISEKFEDYYLRLLRENISMILNKNKERNETTYVIHKFRKKRYPNIDFEKSCEFKDLFLKARSNFNDDELFLYSMFKNGFTYEDIKNFSDSEEYKAELDKTLDGLRNKLSHLKEYI